MMLLVDWYILYFIYLYIYSWKLPVMYLCFNVYFLILLCLGVLGEICKYYSFFSLLSWIKEQDGERGRERRKRIVVINLAIDVQEGNNIFLLLLYFIFCENTQWQSCNIYHTTQSTVPRAWLFIGSPSDCALAHTNSHIILWMVFPPYFQLLLYIKFNEI